MTSSHRITRETGQRIANQNRRNRYQPPRRFKNTRPVGGSSKSETKLVKVPTAGIAAISGSTISHGTAEEQKVTGATVVSNTQTLDLYNPWPFALPGDMVLPAIKERISGKWIAIHPGVVDVQWNDPDLQQTYDGATLLDIDTAEDCS